MASTALPVRRFAILVAALIPVALSQLTGNLSVSSSLPGVIDVAIRNTDGRHLVLTAWNNIFAKRISPDAFTLRHIDGREIDLVEQETHEDEPSSAITQDLAPGATFTTSFNLTDLLKSTDVSGEVLLSLPYSFTVGSGHSASPALLPNEASKTPSDEIRLDCAPLTLDLAAFGHPKPVPPPLSRIKRSYGESELIYQRDCIVPAARNAILYGLKDVAEMAKAAQRAIDDPYFPTDKTRPGPYPTWFGQDYDEWAYENKVRTAFARIERIARDSAARKAIGSGNADAHQVRLQCTDVLGVCGRAGYSPTAYAINDKTDDATGAVYSQIVFCPRFSAELKRNGRPCAAPAGSQGNFRGDTIGNAILHELMHVYRIAQYGTAGGNSETKGAWETMNLAATQGIRKAWFNPCNFQYMASWAYDVGYSTDTTCPLHFVLPERPEHVFVPTNSTTPEPDVNAIFDDGDGTSANGTRDEALPAQIKTGLPLCANLDPVAPPTSLPDGSEILCLMPDGSVAYLDGSGDRTETDPSVPQAYAKGSANWRAQLNGQCTLC